MEEINIKELEYCKFEINCTFDKEIISDKKRDIVPLFKNLPVKGFRKGRAKLSTIEQVYRKQINDALLKSLSEDAYHNAVAEHDLDPFGSPEFLKQELQNDNFECNFVVYSKPKFELKQYKGLEIPKPHVSFVPEDETEKFLEKLRLKNGTQVPYEEQDFVQENDYIIVDYKGMADGEEKPELCAEAEIVFVGGSNIPEFDQNLLGMNVGEERSFNIKLDNPRSDLKGKEITFVVKVQSGSKIVKHPLDDELAVKEGKESLQVLRDEVLKAFRQKETNFIKEKSIESIKQKLIEGYEVEIPSFILDKEIYHLTMNIKDKSLIDDKTLEELTARAKNNIMLTLVLQKIRLEEREAQISDIEVSNVLRHNLQNGRLNPEILKNAHFLEIMVNRIKDDHCLEFVCNNVNYIE